MFFHCCQGRYRRGTGPLASQNFFCFMNFKMWVRVLFCGNLRCGVNDSFQNCPIALMRQWQLVGIFWESFYVSPWMALRTGWLFCSLTALERLVSHFPSDRYFVFHKNQLTTWMEFRTLLSGSLGNTFSWLWKPKTQAVLCCGEISWHLPTPEVVGSMVLPLEQCPGRGPLLGLPAGAGLGGGE